MAGITTYHEGNTRPFAIGTAGALDGKNDFLVELDNTVPNGIKLLATVGNEIGAVRNLLTPGGRQVGVRLLGKDGTLRLIQNAAIARGAWVMPDSTALGKVKAVPGTTGTYHAIGVKLSDGNGAAGEVIEVLDRGRTIVVP